MLSEGKLSQLRWNNHLRVKKAHKLLMKALADLTAAKPAAVSTGVVKYLQAEAKRLEKLQRALDDKRKDKSEPLTH